MRSRWLSCVWLSGLVFCFSALWVKGVTFTYYVDASVASSGDGTSWATAFKTIQEGVSAAVDGDTVLVTNGVYDAGSTITPGYSLRNRVCITNSILVQSVNGPEGTIIEGAEATGGGLGADAVRGVFMNSSGALSGFTVRYGYTMASGNADYDRSAGGVWLTAGCTVSNCILLENVSSDDAGGAYLYYGGMVNNSVLKGNTAGAGCGGALIWNGGELNNCLLIGNHASGDGGGVYISNSGTMNNCTVSGNAGNIGGGIYVYGGGVINNGISWSNSASGNRDIRPGSGAIRNTCASDGVSEGVNGCTRQNPLFLNASALDFRLQGNSPCVNRGNNTYAPTNMTPYDLAGNQRIAFGTVDMGAYEFAFFVTPDNGPLAGGNSVVVTGAFSCATATNLLIQPVQISVPPSSQGTNWFTLIMPACSNAGSVDIVIQAPGEDDVMLANAYSYNPAGELDTVLPASCSWTGGCPVVLSGTNIGSGGTDITNVTLCGVSATILSQSVSRVWVLAGTSMVAAAGDVLIESTAHGATVKSNAFEYTREQQAALVFTPVTPQAYGTTNGLSLTGGSGTGAVSFAVLSGPGTITNGAFLRVGAGSGTIEIRAARAQDARHYEASVTATVEAAKGSAGVYLTGLLQTYDGTARNVTATSTPSGLTVVFTYNGLGVAPVNVGNYAVTGIVNDANWQGAAAGILSVGKGTQVIVFPAIGNQRLTNAVDLSATATSGGTVIFSVVSGPAQITGGTRLTFTNTGIVTVRAAQQGNANWNAAETRQSFRVTDIGVPLDFDGDGLSDIAVYWPDAGRWSIILSATQSGRNVDWGWSEALPVPGDYDGDGLRDIAVYWPEPGRWYIWQSATQSGRTADWGWGDTEPVPGDYDGDGLCDLAVYWPAAGRWSIWQSATQSGRIADWGWGDAEPVPGDYDGDGLTDLAVYWPDPGRWYIWQSATQSGRTVDWGWGDAEPVPGDYDGDGLWDLAVYRPEQGEWSVWLSASQSGWISNWGWNQAWPVPADYDGDGIFDRTVYVPTEGMWYLWQSGSQTPRTQAWGFEEAEPVK